VEFDALSTAYFGVNALRYNERRTFKKRWRDEQSAISDLLAQLPDGLRSLDVPVGTGRTFEFYKTKRFRVSGVDISPDMLSQTAATAAEL